MKKILIGSQYFFSCYPDFQSKDIDEIELVETAEFNQIRQITGRGKCLFQMKKHQNKDDYIAWAIKSNIGMVIGKFLIPEFNKEIGFEIDDLPKIKPLIDRLDDKHTYEKFIYDAYILNGEFRLTDGQRLAAYNEYKRTRNI